MDVQSLPADTGRGAAGLEGRETAFRWPGDATHHNSGGVTPY